jgi:hypothetical protein
MSTESPEDQDPTLPPPGTRWGSGAQSVLPYLTKSLQAKPAAALEHARQGKATERAPLAHRPGAPPAGSK